ncbi:hypothetical protein ACFPRL_26230 [Pseudoclavibacter helvolus]
MTRAGERMRPRRQPPEPPCLLPAALEARKPRHVRRATRRRRDDRRRARRDLLTVGELHDESRIFREGALHERKRDGAVFVVDRH